MNLSKTIAFDDAASVADLSQTPRTRTSLSRGAAFVTRCLSTVATLEGSAFER